MSGLRSLVSAVMAPVMTLLRPVGAVLDRVLPKHPFWQAALVMAVAWVIIEFGIQYIPPLFGARSSPVPASVVFQYMATVLAGVLLYVSADADRWDQFRQPIQRLMTEPGQRAARTALLVLLPLLVGWLAFDRVRPSLAAPPSLRSVHPANPNQITFRGRSMTLATLENPLRTRGDLAEHYETGKRVYYQNCLPCHGDYLDGKGHFAQGLNPVPASFQSNGTIAQLTESYVFWRIAKGGVGLPREGTPWNSAMPAWEDFLAEDEIWAVIVFLYQQTGWQPRALETH